MAYLILDVSRSIAASICCLTFRIVHFSVMFFLKSLTRSLTSSMLSVISHLSSSTTPLTMSAIAKALETLDVIRLEISANEGGSADVPECLQTGQYLCISPMVDIFVKSSYSGMDMFMHSMHIHCIIPL